VKFTQSFLCIVVLASSTLANAIDTYNWDIKAPITRWDEAIPLGNGLTGCLVWGENNLLRFSFDRGDLWDNRMPAILKEPGFTYANIQKLVKEKNNKEISRIVDGAYEKPYPTKLPGIRLELTLKPDHIAQAFNLDMKSALATVTLSQNQSVKIFSSTTDHVTLISCPNYDKASLVVPTSVKKLGYQPPQSGTEGDNLWWKQKTTEDLQYGVYVAVIKNDTQALLAIAFTSSKDAPDFMALAKKQAQAALNKDFEKTLTDHKKWWHDFWSPSSITLPDKKHERYYNLMQYYYGAASRKGAPPMPLQGVWTADAGGLPPWKGDFHNDTNVQMSYWAYYTSGRYKSGESLIDFLLDLAPTHRKFAKAFFGVDGLLVPGVMGLQGQPLGGWAQYSLSPTMSVWLLQNFHWHWRYTMDHNFLKEKCYPYCREMAIAMEALLKPDANGKLKLPLSTSPEIHNNSLQAWLTPNTNNDLALLHWLADVMTEMAQALDLPKDVKRWQKLRANLEDLAVDQNNVLRLAPDESLKVSHRHHSHLMAIYPLGTLNIESSPEDKKTVLASLDELKKLGAQSWVGFSFPWAACLEARAGRPQEAYNYLNIFVDAFTSPNGFNLNGDQSGKDYSSLRYRPFTLEANFGASQAIHEMLLQSWNNKIRLFPAVPSQWADVEFKNLRAEGGWIISAKRKNNQTKWAKITATQDGLLILKNNFGNRTPKFNHPDVRKVDQNYQLRIKAKQSLELTFH
jgi:alpha-L-fucosidase 2